MPVLHPEETAAYDRGGWSAVANQRAVEMALGGIDVSWIAQLVGGGNREAFDKPFLKSPWIYGCVHTISFNLSTVPIRVYRGTEEKPTKVEGGPLFALMQRPCPGMPRADFVYRLAMWLGLRGETFGIPFEGGKPLDKPTLPEAIYIVPPTSMQHDVDTATNRIRRWDVSNSRLKLAPNIPIHALYPNPYSEFRGMSPAEVAYAAADAAYQASIFNSEFLKNSGFVGGVLSYEKPLAPTQRAANEKAFAERHEGVTKSGKTLLLDAGAKFEPNKVTHRDAQFVELMTFGRDTVCAVYGVPPTALAGNAANYATKRSDDRCLWERGIKPVGTRICEYLNLWLRSAGVEEWVSFDWSTVEALQDDLDTALGRGEKLKGLGYTANEVNERLRLGMPGDKKWRDEAWTPATVVPWSSLLASESPDGTDPAAAGAASVQDTAMNGAQVASLAAIVKDVVAGALPPESAKAMVQAAFPALSEAQTAAMIGPAAKMQDAKPDTPTAPPNQPPPPPPPPAAANDAQPEADPAQRGAPAFRVKRTKSEARAASERFMRRVILPAERKLHRAGVSFFASCKRDALRVFDSRGFVAADLELILGLKRQWDERIRTVFADPLRAVLDASVRATTEELGAAFDFDLNDPRWLSTVRDRLSKLAGVNETTIERARSALVKGITEGVGTPDLRRSLEEVFAGDASRALLVARTEVGSVASSARDESYAEVGIERVEWLSANDEHVRESHAAVNGEVRDRGQPFSNGMHYPHDPAADADEVCNCRCDHVAVI